LAADITGAGSVKRNLSGARFSFRGRSSRNPTGFFLLPARGDGNHDQQQAKPRRPSARIKRHRRGHEFFRPCNTIQHGKIDRRILRAGQGPAAKNQQQAQQNQETTHALLPRPSLLSAAPIAPQQSVNNHLMVACWPAHLPDDNAANLVHMRLMSEHPHIATARRVLALEADALGLMSRNLGDAFVKAVETILAAKGRVICTGIGKSGHVARKIAATMASTGTQAYFVHATEASHGDLGMIGQDDVVLALSKSGETKELADMLSYAKRYSIPLIGMTAKADSTLGRAADILLQVPDAAEACAETNAPTTSTTLMIALGDALAVALLESKGFKADHFKVFHPGGKLGAMLRTAST
jgi:D-arabinose 5-phosphate isomerase GutQ